MNWIQQHILVELTRHATRRYSQLRPDGVEGNLFSYHLDGLFKEGLIEKHDRQYQLSTKGLQYAGTLSLETGRTRLQPKILTAVICRNESGQYLMARWQRQPNTGLVSFPHGMMHFGKTTMEMAATELAEKAGLTADLSYIGEVYVRGFRGQDLDRHMLVHLFEGANLKAGRQDELRPDVAEPFWTRLEDLKPQEFVPGFYEIAQLIQKPRQNHIFAELSVNIGK
jgi:ADP-ribose pyrophosphatase YjhB (NUDIX family)